MNNTALGLLLFLLTIAAVSVDYHLHFLSIFSLKLLKNISKTAGSASMSLFLLAFLLYAVRLLYGWIMKNNISLPGMSRIQSLLKLLFKWHPFVGYTAISLAIFHSYTMLFYLPQKQFAMISGIITFLIFVIVVSCGIKLSGKRQHVSFKNWHVNFSYACMSLLFLHKMVS